MKMHKSLTINRILHAVERRNRTLDNPGFCIACGKSSNECEPDAREYVCGHCGKRAVYGAEELLIGIGL